MIAKTARPLKLAFVMELAPRKLGSFEAWLLALCKEARERGHEVDVFGMDPIHPEVARQLTALGAGWKRLDSLQGSFTKAVALLRGYDVLHLNLIPPRNSVALAAYAAWPAKVVFVTHSSTYVQAPRSSALQKLIDRLTFARTARVVGVSDYVNVRDQVRYSIPVSRCRVVYNGVDTSRFRPNRAQASDRPTILCVANLIPEKGINHLVRAFAALKDPTARLQVVGDGPEAEPLRARAAALGVATQVEFLGLRNDVAELLMAADVFVHPALWGEAFGLTIAEAMAASCPVIASRVGAIPELIEDGVTGILCEPGDETELAAALSKLLSNPALRQTLGVAARKRAMELFELNDSVRNHLNVCSELFPAV